MKLLRFKEIHSVQFSEFCGVLLTWYRKSKVRSKSHSLNLISSADILIFTRRLPNFPMQSNYDRVSADRLTHTRTLAG